MEEKTNVMRILEQKKIKYTAHSYINTDAVSGVDVAAALNENPDKVFKTLVTVAKSGDGYKISSLRQPSGESYKLKTYMIVKKQPNGKWLITEEMMQTKQQIFLKYADKK